MLNAILLATVWTSLAVLLVWGWRHRNSTTLDSDMTPQRKAELCSLLIGCYVEITWWDTLTTSKDDVASAAGVLVSVTHRHDDTYWLDLDWGYSVDVDAPRLMVVGRVKKDEQEDG